MEKKAQSLVVSVPYKLNKLSSSSTYIPRLKRGDGSHHDTRSWLFSWRLAVKPAGTEPTDLG